MMRDPIHPVIHPVEIKENIQSKIPYLLIKMPDLEILSDFDGRITIEHPIHSLIHSSIQWIIHSSVVGRGENPPLLGRGLISWGAWGTAMGAQGNSAWVPQRTVLSSHCALCLAAPQWRTNSTHTFPLCARSRPSSRASPFIVDWRESKRNERKAKERKEGKGLGRTHGRTEQTDKRPGPGQTLCSRCSRFFSPFLSLHSPTEREESSCCCTRLLRRRLSPSQLLLLHPRPLLRSRAIVCSLPFPLPSSQLLLRLFSAGR